MEFAYPMVAVVLNCDVSFKKSCSPVADTRRVRVRCSDTTACVEVLCDD